MYRRVKSFKQKVFKKMKNPNFQVAGIIQMQLNQNFLIQVLIKTIKGN